ncbi:2-C-methyl-D-erythritol 4-phosphate cytidylyltransferase [Wolbachia pipientis]|nr:2-C-methyl-D-erythritol 4-phosphate cytidylyltransferase [Wolbachia pipientis]
MYKSYKYAALIVAAGIGKRCKTSVPKQYMKLAGKPVLCHAIEKFLVSKYVDYIRVVINENHEEYYNEAITVSVKSTKLLNPIYGGKTRQESVKLGLESFEQMSIQFIIVHDACRPFVSSIFIDRLIAYMGDCHHKYAGIVPAVALADTVSLVNNSVIESTLCRTKLKAIQTPQIFNFQELLLCHKSTNKMFTDDSSLMVANQRNVITIHGEKNNFKLTTKEDINMAQFIQKFLVGTGYDIHRFIKPQDCSQCLIKICGVEIEHDMAIDAHSDGDVAIHAIVDAILGALGCGDIGEHFPPSSSTWKGCDSSHFLDFAIKKAEESGYSVSNLDVTLVCEQPKISPYRDTMKKSIAKILGISDEFVSIKATTAERLGSIGRQEGISAHVIVLMTTLI